MKIALFVIFLMLSILLVSFLVFKVKNKLGKRKSPSEKSKSAKELFAEHNESLYQDLRKDPQKYWIDSAKNAYNPYNKRGY